MDSYFDLEIMIYKRFWGMGMNIEYADLSEISRFSIVKNLNHLKRLKKHFLNKLEQVTKYRDGQS